MPKAIETPAESAKLKAKEAEQKRLNRSADNLAEKASRTEQNYDKNHGEFTK